MSPTICPLHPGNSDLYGLGIRIGFYTQWASTLLVSIFRHEEEALYVVVNLHLQLAVFACLVLLTVSSSDTDATVLYPSEVIISFWLLIGAGAGTSRGWGLGGVRGVARAGMYAALCGYGVWFWFAEGLEGVEGRDGDDREGRCEQVAWFGRAGMHGPVKGLGKALSAGGLVVCAALLGWEAWGLWKSKVMGRGSGRQEYAPAPSTAVETTGGGGVFASYGKQVPVTGSGSGDKRPRPQTDIAVVLLSAAMTVLSATSIEYLIKANSLVGVNDIFAVGQIIPLLVGVMGLGTTLVSIFWEGRIMEARCLRIWKHHFT